MVSTRGKQTKEPPGGTYGRTGHVAQWAICVEMTQGMKLGVLLHCLASVGAWSIAPRAPFSSSRSARHAAVGMVTDPSFAMGSASTLQQISGLVAEDTVTSVFWAGMSIAAAGVGTTVFAAFIVNGRYDDIEASMFAAQDDDVRKAQEKQADVSQDVADFFGDVNPQASQAPADVPMGDPK